MYGQLRITLLDKAVSAAGRCARAGRTVVQLATRTRLRPTDVYAALLTARFMAAHELIDQAAELTAEDPEAEVVQIRQPLWFGATTIYDEETH
ncbi:hypothetical protein [Streptomyces pinistramenti]|uniref:hypothetical protein n=1 Tax=Streptomyces pinistramenti TaxID=2884812 RepID=UPI001D068D11|nr:hypothetical protein [Streptomyces pinistramenti]MCB5910362.1 hypothetical protein [Streptomyces pinistramenti]